MKAYLNLVVITVCIFFMSVSCSMQSVDEVGVSDVGVSQIQEDVEGVSAGDSRSTTGWSYMGFKAKAVCGNAPYSNPYNTTYKNFFRVELDGNLDQYYVKPGVGYAWKYVRHNVKKIDSGHEQLAAIGINDYVVGKWIGSTSWYLMYGNPYRAALDVTVTSKKDSRSRVRHFIISAADKRTIYEWVDGNWKYVMKMHTNLRSIDAYSDKHLYVVTTDNKLYHLFKYPGQTSFVWAKEYVKSGVKDATVNMNNKLLVIDTNGNLVHEYNGSWFYYTYIDSVNTIEALDNTMNITRTSSNYVYTKEYQ